MKGIYTPMGVVEHFLVVCDCLGNIFGEFTLCCLLSITWGRIYQRKKGIVEFQKLRGKSFIRSWL